MSQEILKVMDNISVPDVRRQRDGIIELEKLMLDKDQIDMPPQHLIHGGMYARAVTVPRGTLLTGHIYKYDHIEIMASGKLAVTTDDGAAKILTGFNLMPAMTGKKRAAYALEETTWITVHSVGDTGSATPHDVQDHITAPTFEELEAFYAEVSRLDYFQWISQQGWTEDYVRSVVDDTRDLEFLNPTDYLVELKESIIEGQGLFACNAVEAGQLIMPARIGKKRTQAGRYINHAVRPNAKFVLRDNGIDCIAIKRIYAGDEITVNYRDVLEHRALEGDLCQG